MKKNLVLGMIILFTVIVCVSSCTQNQIVRKFGGTETITLDPGVRLVNATWKGKEGSDLWLLTKKDSTKATIYSFKEKSNFGVFQGEVIIVEQK